MPLVPNRLYYFDGIFYAKASLGKDSKGTYLSDHCPC